MEHTQRMSRSHRAGTWTLRAINSVFKELFPVISAAFMEVRHGYCHFILVWLLVFLSSPGFSPFWCSPHIWAIIFILAFPMSRERGKPKHGPTYYSFVARHRRPSPSSTLTLPPIPSIRPVGPPLSDQNWVDEDNAMTYVEEEIPLVPPQAPLDSLLLSASDLQEPPHNSGRLPQSVDPVSEMVGCPIEEETPPAWLEERIMATTQFVNAPQPVAASEPETPNTHRFSEEHLQLIFEMRRDMADQLHRQDILSRRLDALFDSLSSEPAKRRCPTCCQPYIFTPARPHSPSVDGNPGSPTV
jgi:hypothetical protein